MLVSIFFTIIAVLQGQGRPVMIAVSFILGAWLVGVPLAWVFSNRLHLVSWSFFRVSDDGMIELCDNIIVVANGGQGLIGLWTGIVVGYVVTTLLALGTLLMSNWEKVAQEVADRARKEKEDQVAQQGYINPLTVVHDRVATLASFDSTPNMLSPTLSVSSPGGPSTLQKLLPKERVREFELSVMPTQSPSAAHPFLVPESKHGSKSEKKLW